MLYTRKGDSGTSGLFGAKKRCNKNSPIFEALGELDELNSLLGVCRAFSVENNWSVNVSYEIRNIQECLFIIQAEIAGAPKTISLQHIK